MQNEELNNVTCPRCGKPSPEEFLSCIYCGAPLNVKAGFISSMGPRQTMGMFILALLTGVLILMWIVF